MITVYPGGISADSPGSRSAPRVHVEKGSNPGGVEGSAAFAPRWGAESITTRLSPGACFARPGAIGSHPSGMPSQRKHGAAVATSPSPFPEPFPKGRSQSPSARAHTPKTADLAQAVFAGTLHPRSGSRQETAESSAAAEDPSNLIRVMPAKGNATDSIHHVRRLRCATHGRPDRQLERFRCGPCRCVPPRGQSHSTPFP
jgi:hypothetical protein